MNNNLIDKIDECRLENDRLMKENRRLMYQSEQNDTDVHTEAIKKSYEEKISILENNLAESRRLLGERDSIIEKLQEANNNINGDLQEAKKDRDAAFVSIEWLKEMHFVLLKDAIKQFQDKIEELTNQNCDLCSELFDLRNVDEGEKLNDVVENGNSEETEAEFTSTEESCGENVGSAGMFQ